MPASAVWYCTFEDYFGVNGGSRIETLACLCDPRLPPYDFAAEPLWFGENLPQVNADAKSRACRAA